MAATYAALKLFARMELPAAIPFGIVAVTAVGVDDIVPTIPLPTGTIAPLKEERLFVAAFALLMVLGMVLWPIAPKLVAVVVNPGFNWVVC